MHQNNGRIDDEEDQTVAEHGLTLRNVVLYRAS